MINKEGSYKLNLEINKDKVLKDIREIKNEVREVVGQCDFELNKLSLKRKDILVIKIKCFFKQSDIAKAEKKLKKKLKRKVLIVSDDVELLKIER